MFLTAISGNTSHHSRSNNKKHSKKNITATKKPNTETKNKTNTAAKLYLQYPEPVFELVVVIRLHQGGGDKVPRFRRHKELVGRFLNKSVQSNEAVQSKTKKKQE
jgi:hypothetical protein